MYLNGLFPGYDSGGGGGAGGDFLADGSVPATGDFDLGGFDLTNVGEVVVPKAGSDDTDYEHLVLGWNNDVAEIGTIKGGEATVRNIQFTTGGTVRLTLGSTGAIATVFRGSSSGYFQSYGSGFAFGGSAQSGVLTNNGADLNSASRLGFSSGDASFQAPDVALRRNAAGVIEVDNGTAGQFRDLIVRGLLIAEQSSDPADPAEGRSVFWQSDGTGAGDDGDIMVKITAGGVTKTATLIDFSAV
jgi:hypothetical protein